MLKKLKKIPFPIIIIAGILLITGIGLALNGFFGEKPSRAGDLTRGLVGHWTFSEGIGTTVRDISGNQNHGELKGGMGNHSWVLGATEVLGSTAVGFGLEFNGINNLVEVPHDSSLNITDAITIVGWAKVKLPDGEPITTCQELQDIENNLSGDYYLANDIDCSMTTGWNNGAGFEMIGDETNEFTGTFDGQGYSINDLYINIDSSKIALFYSIGEGGTIKNLVFENPNITAEGEVSSIAVFNNGTINNVHVLGLNIETTITYWGDIGGLVLNNLESGVIIDSTTNDIDFIVDRPYAPIGGIASRNNGAIINSSSGGTFENIVMQIADGIGGLVGYNHSLIKDSFSSINVRGSYITGGLVGVNYPSGIIENSYATGNIVGVWLYGGLVGWNRGIIENSYATGDISAYGTGGGEKGGLVGFNDGGIIENSYSVGVVDKVGSDYGGLVGENSNSGEVINSYYDSETSGHDDDDGRGEPKTTAQMQDITTFSEVGWDMALIQNHTNETWFIDSGNDYPGLWFELETERDRIVLHNTILTKGENTYSLEVGVDGLFLRAFINDQLEIYTPITDSEKWKHYAMTYDGSEIKLYINGSLATSTAFTGTINTTSTDLIIGQGFSGVLDDVRLYERALSVDEIRQLYNFRGPVAHWKFDEGTATTTFDFSGHGLHGTLGDGTCEPGDGTCPTWTTGKFGSALQFDGESNYVQVTHSDRLDITEAITISAWIKKESFVCGDDLEYEGETYDTVRIGDQCWTAKSLNVGTRVDGAQDQGTSCDAIEKYCYNDLESNCDTYGGLYQWDQMMCGATSSDTVPSGVQGICPEGWYIPSDTEWHTLESYLSDVACNPARDANSSACEPAGSRLAGSFNLWNSGNLRNHPDFDSTGFNALPAGCRNQDAGFCCLNWYNAIWTSTETGGDPTRAWARALRSDWTGIARTSDVSYKSRGWSVRCLLDDYYPNRVITGKGQDAYSLEVTDGSILRGYINGAVLDAPLTSPSEWNHVALAYDNSEVKIYINGSLVNSTSLSGDIATNIENLMIGEGFEGMIDDVRIYDYARTQEQILVDYNAGFAVKIGGTPDLNFGLVGHWTFDEMTGNIAQDYSGQDNHGQLSATNTSALPQWVASDVPRQAGSGGGGALEFDGTNYVDTGDISDMDGVSQLSISAWMKRDSLGSIVSLGKYSSNNARTNIAFWDDNLLYFNITDGSFSWGTITHNNTEWNHVVLVFDGTQAGNSDRLKGYVNGEEQILNFTGTIPAETHSGESSFQIGRMGFDSSLSEGFIDDVRIYNRALSAEEIRYLYNNNGPIGHWKFDEGSGSTAHDSSIGNNHGTLEGNPQWAAGKSGSALEFSGSNHVDLNTHIALPTDFTISTWYKGTDHNPYRGVAGAALIATVGYAMNNHNGKLQLWTQEDSEESWKAITGSKVINDDKWHHLLVVREGATGYVYVDGELDASGEVYGGSLENEQNTWIGGWGHTGRRVQGKIDEVRIYNRALSEKEVQRLYRAGAGITIIE